MTTSPIALNGSADQSQPTTETGQRITQEQLRRYYELRELIREKHALRQELLSLLAAGAPTEMGAFSLRVHTSQVRRLSQARLRELLGNEGVDWLLSQVDPASYPKLTVRPNEPERLNPDQIEII